MKKIIISILILAGVAGIIVLFSKGQSNTSLSSRVSGITTNSASTSSPQSSTTSSYKDGSYTGSVIDVGYGPVQVKAIVASGKLSDIEFLQMPYDRAHSQQLSQESKPILKSQAISAQSAQVDGVSGATSTSAGFIKSLSDALSQAS